MEDNILKEKLVTDVSVEVISKSIIKETNELGFQRNHYIKLANLILDSAIGGNLNDIGNFSEQKTIYDPSKKVKLPLKGEDISIREFDKKTDSKKLKEWFDDEVGRYFILTRATSKIYNVETLIEDEHHILGIITAKDKTPIGLMAFLDYDKSQHKAELRKLIGDPNYRGKGLGKEATKLWVQYGISNLGLHKVYLNTLQTNVRNIRLNEELGFKVEGIQRDECFIDSKYYDLLRMGLLVNSKK